MSKTARSWRAQLRCEKQQRLAILPWRFEPCLVARAILIGSCQIAGRAHRRRLDRAIALSRRSTKRAGLKRPARNKSSANAELLDQILVARFVRETQIMEHLAALRDKLEQPTTGVVVINVSIDMLGVISDRL